MNPRFNQIWNWFQNQPCRTKICTSVEQSHLLIHRSNRFQQMRIANSISGRETRRRGERERRETHEKGKNVTGVVGRGLTCAVKSKWTGRWEITWVYGDDRFCSAEIEAVHSPQEKIEATHRVQRGAAAVALRGERIRPDIVWIFGR